MNLPHHRSGADAPPPATGGGTIAEQALDERSAVTAALLNATSRLVAQTDAMAVIRSMCESLVAATRHIRLAWAWYGDPHTREIRPMVSVGPARAYAESLVIEKNLLTRFGPAFRSLATNQPDATAVSRFSLYGPWRAASRTHGFEIAVAFPLRVPNAHERGLLVFYADDADYFRAIGIAPFRAFALLAESALAQADLRTRLQRQATIDALTGLPNRFLLREELARVDANARRHRHAYAVVMFDLDRFKAINDNHGHDAGDRALVAAGNAATRAMRRGDIVGRWGGDEFLAILPETEAADAMATAGRLRDQLCACTVACGDTSVAIHASFGVAAYPATADAPHALLIAADEALYRAKHEGGDRVVVASRADVPAPRAA